MKKNTIILLILVAIFNCNYLYAQEIEELCILGDFSGMELLKKRDFFKSKEVQNVVWRDSLLGTHNNKKFIRCDFNYINDIKVRYQISGCHAAEKILNMEFDSDKISYSDILENIKNIIRGFHMFEEIIPKESFLVENKNKIDKGEKVVHSTSLFDDQYEIHNITFQKINNKFKANIYIKISWLLD